jgi:hypothetical protein
MVKPGTNWDCPYCGRGQVISEARHHRAFADLQVEGEASGEDLRLGWEAIVCANDECRKLSLGVQLTTRHSDAQGRFYYNTLKVGFSCHLQLRNRSPTTSRSRFVMTITRPVRSEI